MPPNLRRIDFTMETRRIYITAGRVENERRRQVINRGQTWKGDVFVLDLKKLREELDEDQYAAVTAPLGNMLCIANAGSGKTRVLNRG